MQVDPTIRTGLILLSCLTDEELAALNNGVYQGHDLRANLGYDKAKALFYDHGMDGKPIIRPDHVRLLSFAVEQRFGKEAA